MKTKTQLNVRIDAELRHAHAVVCMEADIKADRVTEAALRFFYGSIDPEIMMIRKKVMDSAESIRKGKTLPFEVPAIPFTSTCPVFVG